MPRGSGWVSSGALGAELSTLNDASRNLDGLRGSSGVHGCGALSAGFVKGEGEPCLHELEFSLSHPYILLSNVR